MVLDSQWLHMLGLQAPLIVISHALCWLSAAQFCLKKQKVLFEGVQGIGGESKFKRGWEGDESREAWRKETSAE